MGQDRIQSVETNAPEGKRSSGREQGPPAWQPGGPPPAQARFIPGLQQGAGNRAVSDMVQRLHAKPGGEALPGGVGAVQRKNLEQAGKATGLTEVGQRELEGDPREVKIYAVDLPDQAPNRTEALTAAALKNAQVGKSLGVPTNWTRGNNLSSKFVNAIDPFFLRVGVKFKHKTKDHNLELLYQHAEKWTGYVTRLQDSSNEALTERSTMFDKFGSDPLRETDKFSNVHDTSDRGNISGLTGGTREKNIDAYTKIAGEGARWQCVRKHASKIKNETRFFTRHKTDTGKVFAITFVDLWKNWKVGFDKAYDIPDGVVAASLVDGGTLAHLRDPVDKHNLTTSDYNLDTGAAHVTG